MHWLFMGAAILFEVAGTLTLKLSGTQQRPWLFIGALGLYGACFFFLTQAFKVLPVGVAYAIWSGLGTALIVIIGMIAFGETLTLLKLLFIILIVVGAIGLNLVSEGH